MRLSPTYSKSLLSSCCKGGFAMCGFSAQAARAGACSATSWAWGRPSRCSCWCWHSPQSPGGPSVSCLKQVGTHSCDCFCQLVPATIRVATSAHASAASAFCQLWSHQLTRWDNPKVRQPLRVLDPLDDVPKCIHGHCACAEEAARYKGQSQLIYRSQSQRFRISCWGLVQWAVERARG